MGNRRLGRKRLMSALKKLNEHQPDGTGSRSGLKGLEIPAWELQPVKYFGFWDDFMAVNANEGVAASGDMAQATAVNQGVWNADIGGSSDTITLDNTIAGGVVKLLSGTADNDNCMLQAVNSCFTLDASSPREIWFECRIKANDITGLGIYVGLQSKGGALQDDAAGDDFTDSVGFYVNEGAASQDIQLLTAVGNTETSTSLATNLGNSFVILSFHFDGTSVHAYVNGVKKASTASNLPTDGTMIWPTISASTRDGGGGDTLFVDYIRVCQQR